MVDLERRGQSVPPTLAMDVLLIGGGVQGLWLLNTLQQAGYSSALLEKGQLGGGQSCHSHVYIHMGYLYDDEQLAIRLKETHPVWVDWLQGRRVRREAYASRFGFPRSGQSDERMNVWKKASVGLMSRSGRARVPRALKGGNIESEGGVFLSTPEFCLNGSNLVRELSKEVSPAISHIDRILDIGTGRDGRTVEYVDVLVRENDPPIRLRPKVLVFTAGLGNQELIDMTFRKSSSYLSNEYSTIQHIRFGHMLVIRGHKDNLPPLLGYLTLIVSLLYRVKLKTKSYG